MLNNDNVYLLLNEKKMAGNIFTHVVQTEIAGVEKLSSLASETYNKLTENKKRVFTYPSNLGEGEGALFPCWIEFKSFERVLINADVEADTYRFYMPENVANPNTVSWEQGQLNVMAGIGGVSSHVYSGTEAAVAKAAQNGGGAGITSLNNKFKTAAAISGLVKSAATGSSGILSNATKSTLNPYLTMLFRGVDFRTFEFTFKIYPHSEKDCNMIRDMINSLRIASLPKVKGTVYQFPNEFEIRYKYGKQDNPFLPRFKRCVITKMDTNFTGAGQFITMRNGFPSEIVLNLQFSEIEVIQREDVEKWF